MNISALADAADLITNADALVIAAGAGIGVDSGLPDFRGNEGFWQAYPALAESGLRCTAARSRMRALASCKNGLPASPCFVPEVDEAACRLLNALPRCPTCGGWG